ncbi:MAG: flagellar biosynthesis anti-sigma factor FlgM [Ignavibacteria bacterium]|nr:flagellar biosynthesis anti-sigma factor FlgM [Ignavibacteria bacterium]
MDINSVNSRLNSYTEQANTNYQNPKQDAQKVDENPNSRKDKLEISQEAKALQSQKAEAKNLENIRQKVESGFYNKPEIIEKVAGSILKEIQGEQ